MYIYRNPVENAISISTKPFPNAEAAWFWCVETSEALHHGVRGDAEMERDALYNDYPCEPVDIQTVILRLARQELLNHAHLRTLGIYGQRQRRPDTKTSQYDAALWRQALHRMTPSLQQKGIVA